MPQSLSNVLIHLVFSTKNRVNLITSEIEKELYAYIVSISKTHKCPSLEIGGTENHLHILFRLERTVTISHIVERIKTGSSKWIKTTGNTFKDFGWQNGYGAFSISQTNIPNVRQYIVNQKKHHEQTTFKDEFRGLLKKHNIKYDERYVWD